MKVSTREFIALCLRLFDDDDYTALKRRTIWVELKSGVTLEMYRYYRHNTDIVRESMCINLFLFWYLFILFEMENQKKKKREKNGLSSFSFLLLFHIHFSFPLRIILFMRARADELLLCSRLIFL